MPAFFPKADAAVLQSKFIPPSPTSRPTVVSPILDAEHADQALDTWSIAVASCMYPGRTDIWAPALIPERPQDATDGYLFPTLTKNERLRLTMLSYYTRGIIDDSELVSRLQEKVYLAKESIGWEFVIAGLLDHNTYTRIVTVGLPLAKLPRRESTCAHTVNQPPGTIFSLYNMVEDWRFQKSPHVEHGGLRAYAGAPLRFETEFGESVAFGSLCVASNDAQETLSKSQQVALVRLADDIVSDIIHSARARRQRERRWMQDLVTNAQKRCENSDDFEEIVLGVLREVYPEATPSIQMSDERLIALDGRSPISYSEFENSLWEDYEHYDLLLQESNHQGLVASMDVRIIAAECDHAPKPTFLVVASKDFRTVFDDVDSWLVESCATLLTRSWQSRALKEALAAKEAFLRGITHQLRTPIHGILGSIELLAEELKSRNLLDTSPIAFSPPGSPESETLDPYIYIRSIRTSARELILTVNSMIKLNRWADTAQADRVVSLHHVQDIEKALLTEIIPVMPDDYSSRPSIIFDHHLPPNCDSLIVDLRLLVDCIQPLVINAVQNTAGGVVLVTISVTEDFKSLCIDVEDTGIGISECDQQRIFNAYKKVNEHSTRAGLGLTLATRLATLLDGSVSLVSSIPGKGSHFKATFNQPCCACSSSAPKPPERKFARLPPSFCRLPSSSPASSSESSLDQYLCKYLSGHGYLESEYSSNSILVLNYSTDLQQLRNTLPQFDTKHVALCLVPDSAEIFHIGECIQREKNIVYVRGPFLSKTLEKALEHVHSLLADLTSTKFTLSAEKVSQGARVSYNKTINPTGSGPVTPSVDLIEPLPHVISISGVADGYVLGKSTNNLQIENASRPATPPQSRSKMPMTLIVDDNAVNLRLLQMYCKRRKIPFGTATDGQKAVDIFSKHRDYPSVEPFELVLMDLQMPVCDGIGATQQIRALEKKHGWPPSLISIVTGQDSLSDRTNAADAGAQGFLTKPVGPKVLDSKIKQWFPGLDFA
ncbi:putative histidine kinase-like protein HHK3p [Massarina eburnea CBS 473.64]|uniref:histidine kinase n=1 Tax=Massarina eburnea CBS 473.64 TaxID=1395130 RepID=A0A6A6SF97_9PLEO|nr:putative histidine kinase-like protein HHK3p [Massarina eburnea CBS 473.64]